MQRFIILCTALIRGAGCSKKNSGTEMLPAEAPNQRLVKIEKKTTLSSGVELTDVMKYGYDEDGRMIAEGTKKYFRDEKGRIYRISLPENPSNRRDIYVYYNAPLSEKVSHTICNFVGTPYQFYDSIVYEHDSKGNLVSLVKYISQDGGPIQQYQQDQINYDEMGNIDRLRNYTINAAAFLLCGDFHFTDYDGKVNPVHSTDEVRVLENGWGLSNISSGNMMVINNSICKTYQYRHDGRPRSATVYQDGRIIAELKYYYE